MTGLSWYAVFCKPCKEVQVASYFDQHNVEVYLPMMRVKPANPRCAHERPFFPRYLFIHTDLSAVGFNALNFVPGAVGLVHMGGVPVEIEDEFMAELREHIRSYRPPAEKPQAPFKAGETVRIVEGPFAGYEAIFDQHLSADERVQVLIKWMGHQRKLKVKAGDLRKPLGTKRGA
ncbi:MAG: transcription termination/antitermination NusG family protein [Anaerolineae bacterium]